MKLKEDSAEYTFAKEISVNIPILDPDLNKPLNETNKFNITTSDVFDALFKNFTNDLDKLKNLDSTRLKKIFNENAYPLAEKKMIITSAIEDGFDVSETELDSIMKIQYNKVGGKDKFEHYLKNNNIALDFIIKDYKNTILIQKFLLNAVKDSVKISQSEIQEKLMQVKSVTVRHILFKTSGLTAQSKVQRRKKMEKILDRARKGESFSKLAKSYSEDKGTNKNGGLIKNIKPGDMLERFDKVAFSLAIGEISEVFETPLGYHILTVIDRNKEDRSAAEIEKKLIELKQKKTLPKIITTLKEKFEFVQIKV